MGARQAVFIDRDGVIVRPIFRKGFPLPTAPFSLTELSFFDGIREALALIKEAGFLRILVTNQPDVAYNHMSKKEWEKIQRKVEEFAFDDVFICHHTIDTNCDCRKPKPGMLFDASKKWNINLHESYMIGDTEKDTLAGKFAECRTILISFPYNKQTESDFRVSSFLEASQLIRKEE